MGTPRKRYRNLHALKMVMPNLFWLSLELLQKRRGTPPFPVPSQPIDLQRFTSDDSVVWLGHSTILAHLDGLSFIVDPILRHRASPLKGIGPKRFEGSAIKADTLPHIDIVLITHNHYDHLDEEAIRHFDQKQCRFLIPKGNAHHLQKWGVSPVNIREFEWHEQFSTGELTFTYLPTQHFSGRGMLDRDRSLWGSWSIKGSRHHLYVSGDSGYNAHFKEIGEQYGPFDLACLECGQYSRAWRHFHMIPEESVQASIDLGAKVMLPMHWAGFDISTHAWDAPINRAITHAKNHKVTLATPKIGENIALHSPQKSDPWWESLKNPH